MGGDFPSPAGAGGPLGVFDSGLGGLTVVREILRQTPEERIVYVGDTAHVPYGGRTNEAIQGFARGIGYFLTQHCGCRAVVVACNRATAAAVETLRAELSVPVVGMEPGVKPAAQATRTGRIGVLATPGTLDANRFATLIERHAHGATVLTQPCPGWVETVERGDWNSADALALVRQYVAPLVEQGVDTLVLGCTHYPLLRPLIEAVAGPEVTIVDAGPAVARQAAIVAGANLATDTGCVRCWTTGTDPVTFGAFARTVLGETTGETTRVHTGRLYWREGKLEKYADTAH